VKNHVTMLSEKDVHVLNSPNHVRVRLVRDVKASGPLSMSIRSIGHVLFTKITTRMDRKSRDGYIKVGVVE
jgi:hypothetical protein